MGERLQRLLDDAKKEAEAKIIEAQKGADDMISRAKTDAERKRVMAQRGSGIDELLMAEEEKAKEEAEKNLEDYKKRAEALKAVSDEKVKEAVSLVINEVLPK